ncbi:MAG TPA: LysM peptidoglycan-binding domain-containing protein [Gammaproteobacteria bacterium]|nr:LysM peptidoglycan-binding domain-containing protein [Gammaproteobacteria bacterium]
MIGTKYTVKENDTLWDLSGKFFGDSGKWPLIYSHNNSPAIIKLTGSAIPEQDVIHVGQVLYIPDAVSKKGPERIRYVYAQSKALQYEELKDSVFLKGISAPATKMRIDQITEANFDRKQHKQLTLRYHLARKISNEAMKQYRNCIKELIEYRG